MLNSTIDISNIFVFKTDVQSRTQLEFIQKHLAPFTGVLSWSIDLEDIDNVLRVVTNGKVNTLDIIKTIKKQGVNCNELPD